MNKGHAIEVSKFLESVRDGKPSPISFEEIFWTTKMTFDVITSIKERRTIIY